MTLPTRAMRGWLPVAVGVIVADLITKEWALSALRDRDIEVFWTLQFNLSFNTGMAFSAGQNWGPVIGVVGMFVVVALLLSLRKQNTPLTNVSVGLIVGGAIGNLIDRLFRDDGWFRGAVVDFIDFQWFPIFNVADMGITIGGGLLVLASWLAGRALDDEPPIAVEPSDDQPTDDQSTDDQSVDDQTPSSS